MPCIERYYLFAMQKLPPCGWEGCTFPGTVCIAGDEETLRGCANHAPYLLVTRRTPLNGVPGRCLACGSRCLDAYKLDVGDYRASLCEAHTQAFITMSLTPEAYHRLAADAGDPLRVWYLHEGVYDEDGVSLQYDPPPPPVRAEPSRPRRPGGASQA